MAVSAVAPGFVWAWLDVRVWPWDEAQYAEYTLKTLAAFRLGPVEGIESLNLLLDFKAPGLTWLGVPFALLGRVFGRPEPALLCATLAWQIGTLVACWWSALLVSESRWSATAVTAFVASTPLFIGMNHQYLVEPLQTLAVALSFLLALNASRISGQALLIALFAVVALAMSAKTSSPLYCALPLAYAARLLVKRGLTPMSTPAYIRLALLLVATSALALVALWYALHFTPTFRNVRQATIGAVALGYGTQAAFPAKLAYWTRAFGSALFLQNWRLIFAGAAGLGVSAWLLRRRGSRDQLDQHSIAAAPVAGTSWIVGMAAIHLAAAFTVYSSQINEATRFLEPLLPATAIVLAWMVKQKWRTAMSGAVLAIGTMQYALVYPHALGWLEARGMQHSWLRVVDRNPVSRRQIEQIVRLTCDPQAPGELNMVGVDLAWLSQYSANFYATAAESGRPSCQYTALPYAETDVHRAVQWLEQATPRYYIGVRPRALRSPDSQNRVSAAVFNHVASSAEWQAVASVGDAVVIFRARHG